MGPQGSDPLHSDERGDPVGCPLRAPQPAPAREAVLPGAAVALADLQLRCFSKGLVFGTI